MLPHAPRYCLLVNALTSRDGDVISEEDGSKEMRGVAGPTSQGVRTWFSVNATPSPAHYLLAAKILRLWEPRMQAQGSPDSARAPS